MKIVEITFSKITQTWYMNVEMPNRREMEINVSEPSAKELLANCNTELSESFRYLMYTIV